MCPWESYALAQKYISLNTGVWVLEVESFLGAIESRPWEQVRELHVGLRVFQRPRCIHPVKQFLKTLSLCLIYCTEIWQTGNTVCKMIHNQEKSLEAPRQGGPGPDREMEKLSFLQVEVCFTYLLRPDLGHVLLLQVAHGACSTHFIRGSWDSVKTP